MLFNGRALIFSGTQVRIAEIDHYATAYRPTLVAEFQTYLSHAVRACNVLLSACNFNTHIDVDGDVDQIN